MARPCGGGRIVVATALAALAALAQAEARWYQIEVVGFRYVHAPRAAAETPSELPAYGDAEPLTPADPKAPPTAAPVAFQALARSDKRLEGVYKSLARDGYQPLIDIAWRQPAETARAVHLASDPPPLPATNGARFDGMEGKILVRLDGAPQVELDVAAYQDGTPSRLQETRTIRLHELHYFDHPDLGVLVQISPYDPHAGEMPAPNTAPAEAALPVADPPPAAPAKPGKPKIPALVITPAKPPANAPVPAAPAGGSDALGPGPSD